MGHNALKACNKCLKSFVTPSFGEKAYFGGFDRANWPPTTLEDQMEAMRNHKSAKTLDEARQIERQFGGKILSALQLAITIL